MLEAIIGAIFGTIFGFFCAALCNAAKIGDAQPKPEPRESSGDDRNITGGDA